LGIDDLSGIRELEDEIGVALFIRHPGGVKLINAGSKFLSHARMAVSRIEMNTAVVRPTLIVRIRIS
jgi:DNA-binding transcriptional LysR family regulator